VDRTADFVDNLYSSAGEAVGKIAAAVGLV
jgi:hypothetical protein